MLYNIFLDMGQFFVSSDIQRLPYCTDKRVARMSVRTKWQKYGHKKTGQTVACPCCLEVLVFLFYYRRLFHFSGVFSSVATRKS